MKFSLPSGKTLATWIHPNEETEEKTHVMEIEGKMFPYHAKSEKEIIACALAAQWMDKILQEEQCKKN